MKKYILPVLLFFMILNGCSLGINETSNRSFIDVGWKRKTDTCTEHIFFGSDGKFSYYCSCGEPVEDSDLCEKYYYDEDKKTVLLDYPNGCVEVKVLSNTFESLVLDFGGEQRVFERNID